LFGGDGEAAGEADHGNEVQAIRQLAPVLYGELARAGMQKLYDEIEEPLISVLSQMELVGVKVDLSSLKDFAESLRKQMLSREEEIRGYAENPTLNVSSPKQMGEVIFEKLNLDPKAKKPAKGTWPTDEETLSALADRHPIIDALLDYRGLRKLLSTYIEPFAQYISPVDGRVHTTFNQALTATGRLSSSNPNLQNIPIRTEQGREIRKAFVPGAPGKVMMSADYSQIELRVMAHLCGDEHLRKAFRDGQDVHAATAAKIFGVPVEQVSADERRMAKTANFGIMYGISSFGLAQRLKCPRAVAKKLIDDYFASFPSIRSFIDGTLAKARETLYTETMFGRRRYISDINSHNANIRAIAERNAVNAPIQGTAADIIKLAMIRVAARLRKEGLKAVMVLQIHDELLLEVPENEIDAVKTLLVEEMQGVMELSVPLTVECNYGKTWLEAH
ncbi:MAG: DNA polymerase I, partial [Bacteroidales bacterium]|nr:DNA polymerase I [Bacteroidales bacterium]